jgi:hypothetical protein
MISLDLPRCQAYYCPVEDVRGRTVVRIKTGNIVARFFPVFFGFSRVWTTQVKGRRFAIMAISKTNRLALSAAVAVFAASWCAHQFVVEAVAPRTVPGSPAVTIRIDGSGPGRIFEGIGGLSAGAASRFLIDYPEPYKGQILDYLFKPYYGASLQDLKVEIGGDTNSTWGSEPSHMHSRGDENYHRGYEWWLMREARKRNPQIAVGVLPWGTPGWIGNHHFYSPDMIDYDLKFINAAHDIHHVDVDYVGIWNETRYERSWIKDLKDAVLSNNAKHGLNTFVVAADSVSDWQLADEMNADPALLSAVEVVGIHYPSYRSSQVARDLKRNNRPVPLWASEESYSICPEGVVCLATAPPAATIAKMLNRNYIEGRMTKTIHCTVAAAFPAFMPFKEGLVLATSPWSGHYEVSPSLWGIAHTTQFAQPGWQYLDGASGYLRGQGGRVVGSYVALKAPNNSDYSIIIETADATAERPFAFQVTNGLSAGAVHVWHSNIKAGTYFAQETDLAGDDSHRLTLQPGSIYSLTTTTGQQKGNARTSPHDSPFPFPYANDFEGDALDQPAKYFVDQEGSFEVVNCTGRPGKCMRQSVDEPPIMWGGGLNTRFPLTFLGDQLEAKRWMDYQVGVDVLMEEYGSVTLWGRLDRLIPCTEDKFDCLFAAKTPDGYSINLDSEGRWAVNKSFDMGAHVTQIQRGVLTGWQPKMWHRVKLGFNGSTINAWIDGRPVVNNHPDSGKTHSYGMVALGTEWNTVQLDNFCVGAVCP